MSDKKITWKIYEIQITNNTNKLVFNDNNLIKIQ